MIVRPIVRPVVRSMVNPVNERLGAFSWDSYWATLISASINIANPKNIILVFSKENTSLVNTNFLVSDNSVVSITRSVDNKTLTLVCANNCQGGELVTLDKGVGLTTSPLIILPSSIDELVRFNSINDLTGDTGTYLGATTGGLYTIIRYKADRIMQTGTVTRFDIFIKSLEDFEILRLHIWRKNQVGTYNLISNTDLLPVVSEGANQVTINLSVQEADYWGLAGKCLAGMGTTNYLPLDVQANGMLYQTTALAEPNAWDAKTNFDYSVRGHFWGKAPMLVAIGDSIMESYPHNTSMVDVTRTAVSIAESWTFLLKQLDIRFTYQNTGIGNEKVTDIEARFARDVVAKKPRFAVINGGVNDLAVGTSEAIFIAKITSILDICEVNSIIPILWKIMPWTAGADVTMQKRDTWNGLLETLFASYDIPGKIIIDWDVDLGKFRDGGDAGNLWDIKAEYNEDNVHLNEIGQAKIAEVMLREIDEIYSL